MRNFFVQRWFLLVLTGVLLLGLLAPAPFHRLTEQTRLRYAVVAAVMFVMALPLHAGAMWRALRRPVAPLLAASINLGLLPLLAWGVSQALPDWMAAGLLVAAVTPCTLASASVWTRRAGGNDSVSILVTLMTNAVCFLVTPLWLVVLTGRTAEIPLGDMVGKLALIVVLPMAVAQGLRLAGGVGAWATRQKTPLSVAAQCGVLTMVFFGAVQTGLKLQASGDQQLGAPDLALMLGSVLAVHLAALWAGVGLARGLGLPREDGVAVAFAGSQKTLMVGLQVCMELHITILPMVLYHVSQLLVDTLIADRMRRRGERGSAPLPGGPCPPK